MIRRFLLGLNCLFWALMGLIGSMVHAQTEPLVGLRANTPSVHALTNARIITAPGELIEQGTLIIRDGLIAGVGVNLEIPADARVWDLEGRSIYPGLIDAHADIGLEESTTNSGGGAAYWNPQVRPELLVSKEFSGSNNASQALRSQGVTVAMVIPRLGIFRGQTAVVSLASGNPRDLILNSGNVQSISFSRSGALGGSYPTSGMGAIALMRQVLLDAQWYGEAHQIYEGNPNQSARPERNDSLAALQAVIAGEQPLLFESRNELELLRALRISEEFSLKPWIRGSGNEYRILDVVGQIELPLIVPVNFPSSPNVSHPEESLQVSLSALRHWQVAPENPAKLAAMGIEFVITSDGSPSNLLRNVRQAVTRGLDPDVALAALTTRPAKLLGIDATHGSVEAGKVANLVVVEGKLFEGRGRIYDVWVDGNRFEISAPVPLDPRGEWDVESSGEPQLDGKLTIGRRSGRLTGTWKTESLESINFLNEAGRLRFTLKGDSMELPGKLRMSASVSHDEMFGWGELPDGRHINWKAKRLKDAPEESADEDEEDSDPETEAADGEVSEGDSDEPPRRRRRPDSPDYLGHDAMTSGDIEVGPRAMTPTGAESAFEIGLSENSNATPSIGEWPGGARTGVSGSDVRGSEVRPFNDFGRTTPPVQVEHLLVRNATIWTMGPLGKLENADLLVHRGKVIEVGSSLAPPAGSVTIIDATGLHITPGLIDAHLHSGILGGVNETGHAIVPEVRIGDVLDINTIWTYRQLAGGLTAAHVMHGSANPIGGQNQTLKLRWGLLPEDLKIANAPRTVKFALGENVIRREGRYPSSRMGVEQIIRDNFQAALEYQRLHDEWKETKQGIPPRRNLRLEALVDIVRGDILIQTHSYRQDEILMLIRLAEEFGAKIDVFHHGVEAYRVAPELKAHGAGAVVWSDWSSFKIESFNATTYNARLLTEAGVVTSLHSDNSQIASRMNWEAAKLLRTGLTEEQALALVTINTATVLGVNDQIGSLEPGKDADFVIWSGHPLSTRTRAQQTWIDGTRYFDLDEDRELRKQVVSERAKLIQELLNN